MTGPLGTDARGKSSGQELAGLRLDDNYLADRFAADHGRDVRYCAEQGRWFVWDKRRWASDKEAVVEQLARQSLDRVASDLESAAARTSKQPGGKALLQRARTVRSPRSIRIALRGAAGTTSDDQGARLCVSRGAFDGPEATAHILNCRNGALDLRTFELKPHEDSKDRLITQLCDVDYLPDETCPMFVAALERIFESDRDAGRAAELIDLLQVGLGYSLSGEQEHHLVFLLYGPEGSNGKSFLVQVIQSVVGPDYGCTVPPGLLSKKRGEAHPTGLAELHTRRFAAAMEFGADAAFDAPLLKQLSGSDQLSARRMHEDFWSFAPTHHLWVGSNFVPQADASDSALWRRFRVLPFNRRFVGPSDAGYENASVECRAEPTLAARILEREREGVLAWMVEGMRRLRERGVVPHPKVSRLACEELHREVDPIGQWLEERCEVALTPGSDGEAKPGEFTSTSDLYRDLCEWCRAAREREPSKNVLGRRLESLGLTAAKSGGIRGRLGIRLLRRSRS